MDSGVWHRNNYRSKGEGQMTNEELQDMVETISINEFGRAFKHQASFNKRLRTTGGRYFIKSHHLDFNPKQLEYHGMEAFIGIIKHELCHYHLHLQKKGYKHQDHDFKALLNKVGATRYCSIVPGTQNRTLKSYVYQCRICETRFNRKRRLNTQKYVCGKCKGKLRLIN